MTVIAGIVAGDGTIYMGGDSACTVDSGAQTIMAHPKVFRSGQFLVGCCGSPRILDVMRWMFVAPKHPRGMDVQCFMRTLFVDAIREAMKRAGALEIHHGSEGIIGSEIMVGYRRRLFDIDQDFLVIELADDFCAIGGGAEVAQGALHVSRQQAPKKRLLAAMAASERFNAGVRRPFTILRMEAV